MSSCSVGRSLRPPDCRNRSGLNLNATNFGNSDAVFSTNGNLNPRKLVPSVVVAAGRCLCTTVRNDFRALIALFKISCNSSISFTGSLFTCFSTYASTALMNSLSSSVGRESFMPPRTSLITAHACSGSKYCDSWLTKCVYCSLKFVTIGIVLSCSTKPSTNPTTSFRI